MTSWVYQLPNTKHVREFSSAKSASREMYERRADGIVEIWGERTENQEEEALPVQPVRTVSPVKPVFKIDGNSQQRSQPRVYFAPAATAVAKAGELSQRNRKQNTINNGHFSPQHSMQDSAVVVYLNPIYYDNQKQRRKRKDASHRRR